ncbi:MAG: thioredoxin family protein [Deltaproteobacteria bacterium]
MLEKDYRLVRVGAAQVGLTGLKAIFEELKNQSGKSEPELRAMLAEKTGKRNYIPDSMRDEYGQALLREFKKELGEKVPEERPGAFEVIILGTGCYSCNKLEQDMIAVLSETGIQASLNHITDPNLMTQYGRLAMPAVIINGKVKSKGTVPTKSAIKKWLEEKKG